MKTINQCLMAMKKDEMMEAAFRLGLSRLPGNARKAEWADYIEKSMKTEPERIRMMLRTEDIQELKARLAKGNCFDVEIDDDQACPWDALWALRDCGLAYLLQSGWYVQPCVRGMLAMDKEETEEHRVFDVMADLIEGWLLHVGMMPLFQLIDWMLDEIQPPQEERDDVQAAIIAVLIARRGSECLFTDEEERTWIVHDEVEDPDALLCRLQEHHIAAMAYPPFKAEDLIFSAAYTRLPGSLEIYAPVKEWLEAHDADADQFEAALSDLVIFTQNDDRNMGINSVMRIVPPKDKKDAERLCKAAQQVLNRIPLWMNKGHSAEELRWGTMRQMTALPGRNDPCPCGSGRKYKQCCGKRVN